MSFSLKPKQQFNSEEFDIDYEAIAKQVEDDVHDARISVIVDLGIQKRDLGVTYDNKDSFTVFKTEDEAFETIDQMIEIVGEKIADDKELDIIEEVEDGFQVPFKIYQKKDAHEIAIFADLVDVNVDYGDTIGEKQYRVMLNKSFKGNISGLALTATKPIKGDLWTFAPNSLLTKLANATRTEEIISDKEHNMDVGRLLGKCLTVTTKRYESFVNVKDVGKVPNKYLDDVSKLDNEAVGVSFDNATVELLEAAHLRKGIIDKIKSATNYEGSNMQKAVEGLEAKKASSNSESSSGGGEKEPVQDDKPSRKRRQKPAEKPQEQEDDNSFDDDIPF